MTKVKIVCIIESLGPGGAERQLAYLAALLKQSGEDVELWTYYPNDFNKSILDKYGVRYRYLSSAQNKLKRLIVLKRELRKHHADTVISYLDTCSMTMCAIKLIGARFKLIVSERSSTSTLDRRAKLKYWFYKQAAFIVPNSYSEGNFIKKNIPALASRTKTIVNYVDTERFLPEDNKVELNGVLRMIGVGRISDAKNLLVFADAISLANAEGCKVTVDWYGDTTDHQLRQQLVEKIGKLGIDDVFVLHPQDKQIEKLYPKFEAFCLPSIYEGFPNVICEAMSCGLPVICSNVCDNSYLVEDGVNGIVFNPNQVEDIVKAIKLYVSEIRPVRNEVGKRNRSKIKQICSRESFVEQYKELIYNENTNSR